MKVAIVTESFLPQTNGVVNSVLRVIEHLVSRGDQVLVVCPDAREEVPTEVLGAQVVALPSWSLPGYPDVRVATGRSAPVEAVLREFAPDVVHLASPFVLGWRATLAAQALDLPVVAIYQTDVPRYAERYGLPWTKRRLWRRVQDIHSRATVNLAPSVASIRELREHGVDRVRLWQRGVDCDLFDPSRRSHARRARIAPDGRRLVGFVGRLAPEKQVQDLVRLKDELGIKLVVVGDGPERARLEQLLPDAHFTGMLHGEELAATIAALDVLVSTSETETFCQVVQEALASGVPVVASGAGGPLDLVDHSRTGWLYEPGDLDAMARYVRDLVGDEAKRQAFGRDARRSVVLRGWRAICSELVGHYATAVEEHHDLEPVDVGLVHWRTRRLSRR